MPYRLIPPSTSARSSDWVWSIEWLDKVASLFRLPIHPFIDDDQVSFPGQDWNDEVPSIYLYTHIKDDWSHWLWSSTAELDWLFTPIENMQEFDASSCCLSSPYSPFRDREGSGIRPGLILCSLSLFIATRTNPLLCCPHLPLNSNGRG